MLRILYRVMTLDWVSLSMTVDLLKLKMMIWFYHEPTVP